MVFEKGNLYHIYSQGNNRQPIFFTRENYIFFLGKIERFILPYVDILAWCLMPNHFHLMVQVNELVLAVNTDGVNSSSEPTIHPNSSKVRTLNDSIGIMLRSYTRAINNQEKRTGALFREECKAICLTCNDKIKSAWYSSHGVTSINVQHPELRYPNICFNYINFNPVKDRLVKHIEDWEFSSYSEITGLHNGKLVNRLRIQELGLKFL